MVEFHVAGLVRDREVDGGDDLAGIRLGPVDKVDSQLAADVIQDCFLGGSLGSWFDERQRVGVF
jgi:hypothetical protein